MRFRHLMFTIGLALLAVSLTIPPASADGHLALGSKPPMADVKMKNVDGREVSIKDVMGSKGTLVIFTCNACPWAKKWESRIAEMGNMFRPLGIGTVAINSNDPAKNAEDGYDGMVQRAKDRGLKYPYVVDATSAVARAFGATRTPEIFIFDAAAQLVYHGAPDDNADQPDGVKVQYLRDALQSVAFGKEVVIKETKALGC